MAQDEHTLSLKAALVLLIVGGFVTALGMGGINVVDTTGSRWAWGLVLWAGLLLMAWPILAPWQIQRPAKVLHDPVPGPYDHPLDSHTQLPG